ncbi:unnamed protein product, partial [Dibothriocephalus latus]
LNSHSIIATFKSTFEARRKYPTVATNGKHVRLQLVTASDISLVSKHTWQIERPPTITSDKKAMNISGGFLRLTGELECDISFDGTEFKGTCYLTNRPKLDLISFDGIEKVGLLELPLNRICNGQTLPAKDYRTNQEKWTIERVRRKCRVGSDIWVRHASQLKHTECAEMPKPSPTLSQHTFDLPKPIQETTVPVVSQSPQTSTRSGRKKCKRFRCK